MTRAFKAGFISVDTGAGEFWYVSIGDVPAEGAVSTPQWTRLSLEGTDARELPLGSPNVSVAALGDVNRDGIVDLAVHVPSEEGGCVYDAGLCGVWILVLERPADSGASGGVARAVRCRRAAATS